MRAVADEGFRSFRFEEALSKYEREMNHGPAQPGMQVTNHHYLVDHNDLGLGHSTSFPAIYTHLEEAAIRMAATRANTATHTAMHSLTHSALSATEPAVSMTREIAGPFPLTSMAYVAQDGDTYSGDVAWLESAEATPEFLNAADNSSAASHLDAEVTVGGEQGVSIGLGPSHRPRSLFSPGAGSMFAGVEISGRRKPDFSAAQILGPRAKKSKYQQLAWQQNSSRMMLPLASQVNLNDCKS